MNLNTSIYDKPIQAVLPIYDENGKNVCKAVYENGVEEAQGVKVDTFISNWFKAYAVDLAAKKAWGKKYILNSKLVPLLINEDLVLVPIKCRKVIGENDGSYGYIRYQEAKSGDNNTLLLESNIEVPYLTSRDTIAKKLGSAHLLVCAHRADEIKRRSIYKKAKKIKIDLNDEHI